LDQALARRSLSPAGRGERHRVSVIEASASRALALTVEIDLEATPRIELGMEVLQTSALPLGYVAAPRFYLRRRPSQVGAPLT
jgi:hypothetical protein